MQELDELIQKFWLNETSQEENHRLLQLLQEYKDHNRDKVRVAFEMEERDDIDAGKAAELLTKIHRSLGIEELRVKGRYRYLAVAAAVSAIVLSLFLLVPHRQTAPATATVKREAMPTLPRLEVLASGRDSGRSFTLEDGTTVQLRKNSRLSFYRPFQGDRRDLWLEGTAVFDVTKDKKRPFTVYAGEVATRVLGTRFSVNTSETGKVKVRLLDGKIAVSANPAAGPVMNAVYLTPGQELSFDKNSKAYTVNTIHPQPDVITRPDKAVAGIVFHKEPLSSAFFKIGLLYKAPLSYRKEELDGLYFTGTFLKSDDLHLVLTTICTVNNLVFTEEKDSIIITRSH